MYLERRRRNYEEEDFKRTDERRLTTSGPGRHDTSPNSTCADAAQYSQTGSRARPRPDHCRPGDQPALTRPYRLHPHTCCLTARVGRRGHLNIHVHVPGKVWRGEQPTQKEGWKEWEGDAPEDTTGELQQETQIGWGDRVAIDIPV